ncbi:hypothetical protein [Cryobacterium tagatosivorans]|uniref:Uncharacterized protein n=1 Tax=Cryobacterium tagatosivorans TaxID=1259199 RepID=A0A4R8UGL2_9MICO|nr:hypothetical protein [Cryobacterium tagatosivorans]TFB50380.1 hypothetical protein E3O23_09545 [Cryobacterium tagatosivorans]
MSDDKTNPSAQPGADTPVGDMTEEGETELGPYPSLTNVENWEESDIESAAGDEAEELPE